MDFETVIKRGEKVRLPKTDIGFLITEGGPMLKRTTELMDILVPYKGRIHGLKNHEPYANMILPKMSPEVLYTAISFFRYIHKKLNSEAVLFVYYNPQNKEYKLICPKQEVSYAGVKKYYYTEPINGYLDVGTLHSHQDFGASHSSIDSGDEKDREGFHGTIGNVNRKNPTISITVVAKGHRFSKKPSEFFDVEFSGNDNNSIYNFVFEDEMEIEPDQSWIDRVEKTALFHNFGMYGRKIIRGFSYNKCKKESKITKLKDQFDGYDWYEEWFGSISDKDDLDERVIETDKKIVEKIIENPEQEKIIDYVDNEIDMFLMNLVCTDNIPMEIQLEAERILYLRGAIISEDVDQK